ncbi:MAG: hypothetical protein IJ960_03655, partial [Oscillospiraceae bacterium]|nr:hypothetical protein [Oscillospiraceae bacterium]
MQKNGPGEIRTFAVEKSSVKPIQAAKTPKVRSRLRVFFHNFLVPTSEDLNCGFQRPQVSTGEEL